MKFQMAGQARLDLKQLDMWIREGRAVHVRSLLQTVVASEIQRAELSDYADLARRVQMPELVIRWLRPLIRFEKPVYPPASTKETALYALALGRVGIFKEATTILKALKKTGEPQVFNYLGMIDIEQWNYSSALSAFKLYVQCDGLKSYQRTVGLLNLAACYVGVDDFERTDETLAQLLAATASPDLKLLRANTLELLAQSMIFRGRLSEARRVLAEARDLIGDQNYQYEFFIRKWLAITRLLDSPSDPKAIHLIRDEAVRGRFFETVRECDFFVAMANQNEVAFLKVFFRSHFRAYRTRILKNYNWNGPVPNQLLLSLHPQGYVDGDSEATHMKLDPEEIEMPRLVRDLFRILLSDGYRAFPLTEIFGKIYEDEYFNPLTSPAKVSQLIQALRKIFAGHGIPLTVRVTNGKAALEAKQPVSILLRRKKAMTHPSLGRHAEILSSHFGDRPFTTGEAAKVLNFSERSTRRRLAEAVAGRRLRRTNAGGGGYRYKCL